MTEYEKLSLKAQQLNLMALSILISKFQSSNAAQEKIFEHFLESETALSNEILTIIETNPKRDVNMSM